MDPQVLAAFINEAENTLNEIRGCVFVFVQDGNSSGLDQAINRALSLRDESMIIGQRQIAAAAESFGQALRIASGSNQTQCETVSRSLLDLLAQVEASVLEIRPIPEDSRFDAAGIVDEYFDFIEKGETDGRVSALPELHYAETVTAPDEFEIDAEMLEIFAAEADELLQNIAANLDLLSRRPNDREALWEIRRSAHTFKGSAGIVGLKKPSELAHRVEDLLEHLSENAIGPDEKVVDILRSSTDCLRAITVGGDSADFTKKATRIFADIDAVMSAFADKTPIIVSKTAKPEPSQESKPEISEKLRSKISQTGPVVRVSASRLGSMARIVGDLTIGGSAIEQRMAELERQIEELHNTTRRLHATGHKLETDFEASMPGAHSASFSGSFGGLHQMDSPVGAVMQHFDPLELDRYTDFHQSVRELSETANDNFAINTALEAITENLETLFGRQRILTREMQETLVQIRMVAFGAVSARLQRANRVVCEEENKNVALLIENPEVEVDSQMLETLIEPLMHLLRNAVVHGIEDAETRRRFGKPEIGTITIGLAREQTHLVLRISDDGRGISGSLLKDKAVESGLIDLRDADDMDEDETLELIYLPGLTTAETLSMSAGRGVGMSIVRESIESEKGTISVKTASQKGTTFTIRVPVVTAVNNALIVKVNQQSFAVPINFIDRVADIDPAVIQRSGTDETIELYAEKYCVKHLSQYLTGVAPSNVDSGEFVNSLLIKSNGVKYALAVDEILRSEEIVIKPLGTPLDKLKNMLGAAILGSGELVPVLDLHFVLKENMQSLKVMPSVPEPKKVLQVLIVDDSPSVRHMTAKVIEGSGWTSVSAKDGVEALELLRAGRKLPDLILTDVEMPRMDGYELVSAIRKNQRLAGVPIVFITSRSSAKHRERAAELGIEEYLTKPFEEAELVAKVERLANIKGRSCML